MTENSNIVQTDSDGKATYTPPAFDSLGTQTMIATETASGISASTEIEVINIDRIDVTASEEIISDGIDTMITAIPYSNNVPVPNLLIHIDGADYVTNSEGIATHFHRGENAGLTAIVANCGELSDATVVTDVYQYFNQAENKEYNFAYYPMNSLSITRKYNGLELANSNSEGSLFILHEDWGNSQWQLEFNVISVQKNTSIEVCGTQISYELLKSKPLIQVSQILQNGTYVKNVYLRTSTNTRMIATETTIAPPIIKVNLTNIIGTLKGNIIIDNIKLMKVGV